MAPQTTTRAPQTTTPRYENLRRSLEQRRDALLADVRDDIRKACDDTSGEHSAGVLDLVDTSEVMFQDAIRFELMHMKSETLVRIDEALARMADGRYGVCEDCEEDIPEPRLRALPFAVRCVPCEELHERVERERREGSHLLQRLTDESPAFD